MNTQRLNIDEIISVLIPLIRRGDCSMNTLMTESNLTREQVYRGTRHIRQSWAGDNGEVYAFLFDKNVYTFIDTSAEAVKVTGQMLSDLEQRLLSLDAGKIQGMVAQGMIPKRLARMLNGARDEIADLRAALV